MKGRVRCGSGGRSPGNCASVPAATASPDGSSTFERTFRGNKRGACKALTALVTETDQLAPRSTKEEGRSVPSSTSGSTTRRRVSGPRRCPLAGGTSTIRSSRRSVRCRPPSWIPHTRRPCKPASACCCQTDAPCLTHFQRICGIGIPPCCRDARGINDGLKRVGTKALPNCGTPTAGFVGRIGHTRDGRRVHWLLRSRHHIFNAATTARILSEKPNERRLKTIPTRTWARP